MPDRIPVLAADVEELKTQVHAVQELVRDARERLSGISAEIRIIIGLLVANGALNLISIAQGH